jgi:outer membrane lipoprotein carrier protein
MKRSFACLLLFFSFAGTSYPSDSVKGVSEPEQNFFGWLDSFKTFSAKFDQTFESKGFGITDHLSGTIYIQKPDRLRFEYTKPAGRLVVADGKKIWFYEPDEKTVYRGDLKNLFSAGSPALLLAGRGKAEDIFDIYEIARGKKDIINGTVRLKMVPKKRRADIKALLVTADQNDGKALEFLSVDHYGNRNRISLSAHKRGEDLENNIFVFKPGKDVKVLPLDKAGRM